MNRPPYDHTVAERWPGHDCCPRCGRLTIPFHAVLDSVKEIPALGAFCRCKLFDRLEAGPQ